MSTRDELRDSNNSTTVETLLEEGLAFFGANMIDSAVEKWKQVLEVQPGEPRACDYLEAAGIDPEELAKQAKAEQALPPPTGTGVELRVVPTLDERDDIEVPTIPWASPPSLDGPGNMIPEGGAHAEGTKSREIDLGQSARTTPDMDVRGHSTAPPPGFDPDHGTDPPPLADSAVATAIPANAFEQQRWSDAPPAKKKSLPLLLLIGALLLGGIVIAVVVGGGGGGGEEAASQTTPPASETGAAATAPTADLAASTEPEPAVATTEPAQPEPTGAEPEATPTEGAPGESGPALPDTYVIRVKSRPDTAVIELDGETTATGFLVARLARDGASHTIRVSANGYEPQELTFIDEPPPKAIRLTAESRKRVRRPVTRRDTRRTQPTEAPPTVVAGSDTGGGASAAETEAEAE